MGGIELITGITRFYIPRAPNFIIFSAFTTTTTIIIICGPAKRLLFMDYNAVS
jgi:hypothetical protein